MMVFKAYWRKLVTSLIKTTPGIGNQADAVKAVQRSKEAVTDAQRVHGMVVNDADYLVEVKRQNHFREQVLAVWTAHNIGRQS